MILVRKNILTFNDISFKCSIGKNGITEKKIEGDSCTPAGEFTLGNIYYRKDKVILPNIRFKKVEISRNLGWCDDVNSNDYNKLINFPYKYGAEKFFRDDDIYNIICDIKYNSNPVIKSKGSAIFIHVARDDYLGTEGCIALNQNDLIKLLSMIDSKTKINISI